jgi:hypothetical protein
MSKIFILLCLCACAEPCKTSTLRCKGQEAQVCMDDEWVTARECKYECYMKEGWPTCLE